MAREAAQAAELAEEAAAATRASAPPGGQTANHAANAGSKKSSMFVPQPEFAFADPCPESMRDVRISDLSSVDINWKMLTLARPTNKTDEEIFSKWALI